jgi:hypothetical protein
LRTELKILEMAGLGFTLGLSPGTEALLEGGIEARMLPRVLAWCDGSALALGEAMSALDEHRGWILETYGEQGKTFLRRMDQLSSAVALYGMGRVAMLEPRLLTRVRVAWRDLLNDSRALERLAPARRKALEGIHTRLDDAFEHLDDVQLSRGGGEPPTAQVISLDSARKPPPPPAPARAGRPQPAPASAPRARRCKSARRPLWRSWPEARRPRS